MSKVVILWFNFSSSTSYPHGLVRSGLSLYSADLVDKNIGHQHGICNCGGLRKRSINVTNRRDTYLAIKDIKRGDVSAVGDLLEINKFYDLLKKTIQEVHSHTFDFEGRNMAVYIDEGERFDDLTILEKFKVKLTEHYTFNAPIDITKVSQVTSDEEDVNTIPFMNIADSSIDTFVVWATSLCPSL